MQLLQSRRWKNGILHLASLMVPPRSEVLTLGECLHYPPASNSQTIAEGGLCLRYVFQFHPFDRFQLILYLDSSGPFQPWITPTLFDETNNPDVVDEWTFCQ